MGSQSTTSHRIRGVYTFCIYHKKNQHKSTKPIPSMYGIVTYMDGWFLRYGIKNQHKSSPNVRKTWTHTWIRHPFQSSTEVVLTTSTASYLTVAPDSGWLQNRACQSAKKASNKNSTVLLVLSCPIWFHSLKFQVIIRKSGKIHYIRSPAIFIETARNHWQRYPLVN